MTYFLNRWFIQFIIFLGVVISGLALWSSNALAVEVNSADQSALESVRGLGPSKAQAILAERKKNGPFKDAADLHSRVKGVGEKTVERLMSNGLTINGSAGRDVKAKRVVKSQEGAQSQSAQTSSGRKKAPIDNIR